MFQLLIQVPAPPESQPSPLGGSPCKQLRFAAPPIPLGLTVHRIEFKVFYRIRWVQHFCLLRLCSKGNITATAGPIDLGFGAFESRKKLHSDDS